MIVRENDTVVLVEGNAFKYYLNKQTGLFDKILYNGTNQIMQPMEVNILRALTDKDMNIKQEWYRARHDKASVRAYNITVESKENTVIIKCLMSMAADAVQRILDIETVWTVDVAGAISCEMNVKRCPEFSKLPRFGICLYLDKKTKMATSESGFLNNASLYTHEELTTKKHNYEHEESEYIVLCLGYAQNGIGSNSCGPENLHGIDWIRKNLISNLN